MLNIQAGQIFDFLCENFYRHASEYVQTDCAKCGAFFFFSPALGKSLNIIEEIEGLLLVDTSFAPKDNPRPVKKNGHVSLVHWLL